MRSFLQHRVVSGGPVSEDGTPLLRGHLGWLAQGVQQILPWTWLTLRPWDPESSHSWPHSRDSEPGLGQLLHYCTKEFFPLEVFCLLPVSCLSFGEY